MTLDDERPETGAAPTENTESSQYDWEDATRPSIAIIGGDEPRRFTGGEAGAEPPTFFIDVRKSDALAAPIRNP